MDVDKSSTDDTTEEETNQPLDLECEVARTYQSDADEFYKLVVIEYKTPSRACHTINYPQDQISTLLSDSGFQPDSTTVSINDQISMERLSYKIIDLQRLIDAETRGSVTSNLIIIQHKYIQDLEKLQDKQKSSSNNSEVNTALLKGLLGIYEDQDE